MADGARTDASVREELLKWALPAFHTAVVTVLGVTLLHRSGALGDLLGGLRTATGLVLYLLLWGTTWATNRQVLARAVPGRAPLGRLLRWGVAWGFVTGAAFLVELVVVVVGSNLLAEGFRFTGFGGFRAALPLLSVLVVVTAVAGVVGAVIGGLLSLLDAGLARASRGRDGR